MWLGARSVWAQAPCSVWRATANSFSRFQAGLSASHSAPSDSTSSRTKTLRLAFRATFPAPAVRGPMLMIARLVQTRTTWLQRPSRAVVSFPVPLDFMESPTREYAGLATLPVWTAKDSTAASARSVVKTGSSTLDTASTAQRTR